MPASSRGSWRSEGLSAVADTVMFRLWLFCLLCTAAAASTVAREINALTHRVEDRCGSQSLLSAITVESFLEVQDWPLMPNTKLHSVSCLHTRAPAFCYWNDNSWDRVAAAALILMCRPSAVALFQFPVQYRDVPRNHCCVQALAH